MCVHVHLYALTVSLYVSVCSSVSRSSAVNSKWHSSHIFRPDMSPTWHSRISDLSCWHAVSRREAMEQSKLMLSRERQRERLHSGRTQLCICIHPKFRWGQTRTLAALRLATVFWKTADGREGVNFNPTKCSPSLIWSKFSYFYVMIRKPKSLYQYLRLTI